MPAKLASTLSTVTLQHPRQPCHIYSRSPRRAVNARPFTYSARRPAEPLPDHYATLSLSPSATPADIKKQFYTLSKKYHPDLHPSDPNASRKFVQVSEAYHTLGSKTARQQYDQQYFAEKGGGGASVFSGSGRARSGSYSSASDGGPAGARPASGLSRRRSQFRGPPPSFYRNGAWGSHGAKRSAAQGSASHTGSDQSTSPPPGGAAYTTNDPFSTSRNRNPFPAGQTMGSGGFSPGQEAEYDPDPSIPHWDRAGHFRTHEGIRLRRGGGGGASDQKSPYDEVTAGGSFLFNFVAVSGLLGFVVGVPTLLMAK